MSPPSRAPSTPTRGLARKTKKRQLSFVEFSDGRRRRKGHQVPGCVALDGRRQSRRAELADAPRGLRRVGLWSCGWDGRRAAGASGVALRPAHCKGGRRREEQRVGLAPPQLPRPLHGLPVPRRRRAAVHRPLCRRPLAPHRSHAVAYVDCAPPHASTPSSCQPLPLRKSGSDSST